MKKKKYNDYAIQCLAHDIIWRAVVDRWEGQLDKCLCGQTNLRCTREFFNSDLFDILAYLDDVNANSIRASYKNMTPEFKERMSESIDLWKKKTANTVKPNYKCQQDTIVLNNTHPS